MFTEGFIISRKSVFCSKFENAEKFEEIISLPVHVISGKCHRKMEYLKYAIPPPRPITNYGIFFYYYLKVLALCLSVSVCFSQNRMMLQSVFSE